VQTHRDLRLFDETKVANIVPSSKIDAEGNCEFRLADFSELHGACQAATKTHLSLTAGRCIITCFRSARKEYDLTILSPYIADLPHANKRRLSSMP